MAARSSQRAAIAVFYAGPVYDELMGELKKDAKGRQGKRNDLNISETFPRSGGKEPRDLYGKRWNVNGKYISDLETIREEIAQLEELAKRPEAETMRS